MLTKKEVIEILRRELPYFVSCYGVKRIGLFGSYAKGTQAEDSDVDVVVEFERPIGLKFVEFGDYLERILGKKTDILTPAGLKSAKAKGIVRDVKESVVYI